MQKVTKTHRIRSWQLYIYLHGHPIKINHSCIMYQTWIRHGKQKSCPKLHQIGESNKFIEIQHLVGGSQEDVREKSGEDLMLVHCTSKATFNQGVCFPNGPHYQAVNTWFSCGLGFLFAKDASAFSHWAGLNEAGGIFCAWIAWYLRFLTLPEASWESKGWRWLMIPENKALFLGVGLQNYIICTNYNNSYLVYLVAQLLSGSLEPRLVKYDFKLYNHLVPY